MWDKPGAFYSARKFFLKKRKENEKHMMVKNVKGTQELIEGCQWPTLEQFE